MLYLYKLAQRIHNPLGLVGTRVTLSGFAVLLFIYLQFNNNNSTLCAVGISRKQIFTVVFCCSIVTDQLIAGQYFVFLNSLIQLCFAAPL